MRRCATLAVMLLALSNCTNVSRCKSNTLLVTMTLQNTTAGADQLIVAVTVDNGAAVVTTVAHPSGRTNGTIEIDFPSGYPVGQSITVDVSATEGNGLLAEQSISTTLSAGCTTASLTLTSSDEDMLAGGGDMSGGGGGGDLAAADLAGSDLAMSDMAMPALCTMVTITTLTGNGTPGFVDGTGGAAGTTEFNGPAGLALDSAGNLYVADANNNRIRKVASDGSTTTLTGNGTRGYFDGTGGAGGTTEFNSPIGVAVDGAGNVYVGDAGGNRVRKVASDGTTTTLSGDGTQGFADGVGVCNFVGCVQAEFFGPAGVALDSAGHVFVADYGNNRVRKVGPDGTTTTLAGNGTSGFVDGTGGATGTTMFSDPHGLGFDSTNNLIYVADNTNSRIRKVASDGTTSTLAGNGGLGLVDGTGGPNGSAEFTHPFTVTVDNMGNVYVADDNNAIRKISPTGTTTTIAKNNGTVGTGCAAGIFSPRGLALSGKVLFVSDLGNNRILRMQLP